MNRGSEQRNHRAAVLLCILLGLGGLGAWTAGANRTHAEGPAEYSSTAEEITSVPEKEETVTETAEREDAAEPEEPREDQETERNKEEAAPEMGEKDTVPREPETAGPSGETTEEVRTEPEPEEKTAAEAVPEEKTGAEPAPEEKTAAEVMPEEKTTVETTEAEGIAAETMPEEAAAAEKTQEETIAETTAEATTEEAPARGAAEKTTPEEMTPEETPPMETTGAVLTPEEKVPEKTTPEETTREGTTPEETKPEKTAVAEMTEAETPALSCALDSQGDPAVPVPEKTVKSRIRKAVKSDRTYTRHVVITRDGWVRFGSVGEGATGRYHVTFKDEEGNKVDQDAFCVEPRAPAPEGTHTAAKVTELSDSRELSKIAYYGSALSGDDGFFRQEGQTGFSADEQYGIVHWALSRQYGSRDWALDTEEKGRAAVEALIRYAESMPDVPDPAISFRVTELKGIVSEGNPVQSTPETTFLGAEGNTATFTLPEHVTLHNVTNGTTSGESDGSLRAAVQAGDTFYFSAPVSAFPESCIWTAEAEGKYTAEVQSYLIDAGLDPDGDYYQPVLCVQGTPAGNTASLTVEWQEDPNFGRLRIVKTAADTGEALEGAVFRLLDEQGNALIPTEENGTNGTIDGEGHIVTGSDGMAEVKHIPVGQYALEEIAAPFGYLSADTTIPVAVKGRTELQLEDAPVRAGIAVRKKDPERGDAGPQGDASLAGAEFAVLAGEELRIGTRSYAPGETVAQLQATDETGTASTPGDALTEGSYILHETKAPEGMDPAEDIPFSVSKEDHGKYVETAVQEPLRRGGLRIRKIDRELEEDHPQGDASLSGAEFTVYNASANPVSVKGMLIQPGEEVLVMTTDENGYAETEPILPYGTYRIRETKAPEGYLLNGYDELTEAHFEEEGEMIFGEEVREEPQKGGIIIYKVDAETKESTPQGDALLAGAEYTITNISEHEILLKGKMAQPGRTVLTIRTDTSGVARTGLRVLPYGTYRIEETRTTDAGYRIVTGSREVRITEDGRQEEIVMEEELIRGGVRIRKIDGETGSAEPLGAASLAGAEFTVFNRSAHAVRADADGDGTREKTIPPGEAVCVLRTDENGLAETAADVLPYGSYEIVETKSPEGYRLPEGTEEHPAGREFVVREDGEIVDLTGEDSRIADRVIRGDLCFRKEDGNRHSPMPGIPFRITSLTTGETHIVCTDEEGRFDSRQVPHDRNTNVLDDADFMAEMPREPAGLWFGQNGQGEPVPADPAAGALPYDRYRIEELACAANEGMKLYTGEFAVTADGGKGGGAVLVDLGRIENLREPEIRTVAEDAVSGTQTAEASGQMHIRDTILYRNLIIGEEYRMIGVLVLRETGQPLRDKDGREIRAEKIFVPEDCDGSLEMEFVFDGSELGGSEVLVTEKLDLRGEIAALHEDPEDKAQMIRIEEKMTEPETSEPGTSEPETDMPETSEPGTSEPETDMPETSEPEVTKPEEPESSGPEGTKPEEPESSGPEGTKPEEPESSGPEATKPEEPESSEPEGTKLEESESSEPEWTKPEEPKSSEPEATKPEEPQPTEPETGEPDLTETPEETSAEEQTEKEESSSGSGGKEPPLSPSSRQETESEPETTGPAESRTEQESTTEVTPAESTELTAPETTETQKQTTKARETKPAKTDGSTPGGRRNTPKTGLRDHFVLFLLLAAAGFAGTLLFREDRKDKRK